MNHFVELRTAAGLGDRAKFMEFTGLSARTLSYYDHQQAEPSKCLVMLLRMLANGCQHCVNAKQRATCPHHCEMKKENQECQSQQQPSKQ